MYRNLRKLGGHIFALDYRGYGDSTGVPTEEGVVLDVFTLYNLIMSYRPDAKIYLYGHSLGTGYRVLKNLIKLIKFI